MDASCNWVSLIIGGLRYIQQFCTSSYSLASLLQTSCLICRSQVYVKKHMNKTLTLNRDGHQTLHHPGETQWSPGHVGNCQEERHLLRAHGITGQMKTATQIENNIICGCLNQAKRMIQNWCCNVFQGRQVMPAFYFSWQIYKIAP